MRGKEDAQDYRYFPDPDLPPLVIDDAWIARVRSELPELPDTMRARLVATHGLTDQDAAQLTSSYELAAYYEAVCESLSVEDAAGCKPVANWVLGEFSAALNRSGLDVASAPVAPESLAALLRRIADGTLSGKMAKEVFDELWSGDANAESIVGQPAVDAIIDRRGLRQVSDATAIEAMVDAVIAAQPAIVAEFRSGKEKAFNALVGHVMKASKGKANPGEVNAVLRRKLAL
jgi:aspartyl-tRNA(Asn)/glutamyl-tRNA(Gln) amidotransferase subunit B